MALSTTTTLRVPIKLRDEISRLADQRGSTMLEVVTDAVHRLSRDEWWDSVHHALDDLDAAEVASYQAESSRLNSAASDGIGGC